MSIPESVLREIERAIQAAEFPRGMSVHDGKAKVDSSHLRRLLAELAALRERAERAEAALLRKGYRMSCDIPACNCGDQWTHGGHAEMRLTEIREALEQADARRNGETLLADVVHIAARAERATTIEAELAALRAELESAHAAQRHAETELSQYMAWYAMAEHQHLHEKARAERAEANAANWEEQANDRVSDWDEVRAERDALKLRLAAVEDMNAACNADFSRLRAERDALRARLDIRYDTAEGQPTGYGEDEIDRLRAAIETAPHAPHCLGSVALGRPSAYPCHCWKRDALAGKPA